MKRIAPLLSILLVACVSLWAQGTTSRLNDNDIERLLKNIQQDAKTFEKSFDKAMDKSSIRKTSREKEAKQLAERFVEQTERMHDNFKSSKKVDTSLPLVYQSVNQLDKWIAEVSLQGVVTSDWDKVRTELRQVADQFGYQPLMN